MRILLASFVMFCLFLSGCQAETHSNMQVLPQYKFEHKADIQAEVDDAIERAVNADKLFLLVLGAQWCHDSRGLAQQFSTENMQTVLADRFETVFVDVGYYQDLRELTTQFGYPGYFATPSVMVIDPETKQLLNMQSMAMWNAADSVPSDEVISYFQTVGLKQTKAANFNAEKKAQLKRIQDFAYTETARLFTGFEKLGPLIQSVVNNELDDETQVRALADEIYAFRMALQKDIHRLHQQIEDASSNELGGTIELPTYGPFSWES